MDQERVESLGRMIQMNALRTKVQDGANLLDKIHPDWRKVFQSIEPHRLRMSECRSCVLGHLYGNYWTGAYRVLTQLFPDRYPDVEPSDTEPVLIAIVDSFKELRYYGFIGAHNEDYPVLKELWLEEIYSREDRGIELGA